MGRFVVIEGPNGSGKTTLSGSLKSRLLATGRAVVQTSEPTATAFGNAIRLLEPGVPGRALALAVAADRAMHVSQTIAPALAAGQDVICDRYTPSSLVLQRIDGVGIDDLLAINQGLPIPDLTVYLAPPAGLLETRLSARHERSRLEELGGPETELRYYRDAYTTLDGLGWRQLWIDRPTLNSVKLVEAELATL